MLFVKYGYERFRVPIQDPEPKEWVKVGMLLDHQAEHERRQEADSDHDDSSCYCCCLDCEDLIEKERKEIPGERIGDGE